MGKCTIIWTSSLIIGLSLPAANADDKKSARFHMDNTDDFISEKTSVFTINKREFDPFGKPIDPHRKIAPKPKTSEVKKAPPKTTKKEQQILIEKEIAKLGENINVLGRRFIHGNSTYQRNDEINVIVKEKTFPLKILMISSKRVMFKDLTNNNVFTLNLGIGGATIQGNDDRPDIGTGPNKDIDLDN
ncbi:hypothetical protein [Rubritalea tangerina]|uniref:Uncharacterized protein n=1 Tax=Rubritalea tangerina TaxID=430798 RepID=A0ABW4Z667_9BACT